MLMLRNMCTWKKKWSDLWCHWLRPRRHCCCCVCVSAGDSLEKRIKLPNCERSPVCFKGATSYSDISPKGVSRKTWIHGVQYALGTRILTAGSSFRNTNLRVQKVHTWFVCTDVVCGTWDGPRVEEHFNWSQTCKQLVQIAFEIL